MAASIPSRLRSCETLLLEAISVGGYAVDEFHQFWDDLTSDVNDFSEDLDDETLTLAYTVACNVEILSQGFAECDERVDNHINEAMESFGSILRRFSSPSSSNSGGASTRSKHIPTCYKWLAANLHNPYPSTEQKQRIAYDHSVPFKFVDDWFQRARRRIGWNAVCNKLFKGNRAAMLIISHQFFVDEDAENPLTLEAQQMFADIKIATENLYNNRYNVSAEIQEVTKQATRSRTGTGKSARKSQLPTPPLSGGSSPEPSTSNKRKSDEAGLSYPSGSGDGALPSPVTEGDSDPLATVDSLFPNPAPAPVARSSKKRRLSHGDAEGRPKRPRGLPPARKEQTVSDPIPKSASIPDLQAPVDVTPANVEVPMYPPIPDMTAFATNGPQENFDTNFFTFDPAGPMPDLATLGWLNDPLFGELMTNPVSENFFNNLPTDMLGMGEMPVPIGGMDLGGPPWDGSIPGPVSSANSAPPAGTELILSSTTSLRPMDNQPPLPSMVSPLPHMFMDNHPLPSMNFTISDMPAMPDFGTDLPQFGSEFFGSLDMTMPTIGEDFFAGPAPFDMSAAPLPGPLDFSLPGQAILPAAPSGSQEDPLPSFDASDFPDFLNMPALPQAFDGLNAILPPTIMAPAKSQAPAPVQSMGDFVLSVLDEKSKTDAQSLDAIIMALQQQKALLALKAGEASATTFGAGF